MAHESVLNVPLTFRFLRIPTTWRILDAADAEKNEDLKAGWESDAQRIAWGRIQFGAKPTALDGWECRDEFFRLPQTEEALLAFLNKTGLWWSGNDAFRTPQDPLYTVEGRMACEPNLLNPSVEHIWNFREELKEAIKAPETFIARYGATLDRFDQDENRAATLRKFEVRFEFSRDVPKAIVPAITCEEILLATVYADLIQGYRFKFCKRKDCRLPFAVTSGHKRSYCSQYCGHLESLRKKRRKETKHAKKW
jgi:hypothetical protein